MLNISLSLSVESPPERTGRRRSMPGSSADKTTPAMEAVPSAATPFRVTVSTVSRFLRIVFAYLWFSFFHCVLALEL